jgi:hypothetical protein
MNQTKQERMEGKKSLTLPKSLVGSELIFANESEDKKWEFKTVHGKTV